MFSVHGNYWTYAILMYILCFYCSILPANLIQHYCLSICACFMLVEENIFIFRHSWSTNRDLFPRVNFGIRTYYLKASNRRSEKYSGMNSLHSVVAYTLDRWTLSTQPNVHYKVLYWIRYFLILFRSNCLNCGSGSVDLDVWIWIWICGSVDLDLWMWIWIWLFESVYLNVA